MKKITKKGIQQKIIISILLVLSINFIIPTYSHASAIGTAVREILALLGDAAESLMQRFMSDGGKLIVGNNNSKAAEIKETPIDDNEVLETVKKDDMKTIKSGVDKGEYKVPVITYSPEEIFSDKVKFLDINFINPSSSNSSAGMLQKTVASWYIAFRNLAVVGLLCVLVYIGIRILISSTASSNAKYKEILIDWLIALCIVFFLHYIMSFALTMVKSINEAIAGDGKLAQSTYIKVEDGSSSEYYKFNMISAARFMVGDNNDDDSEKTFGYLIIYLALVAYTIIFTIHYIKRVLYMAFLTIIAPLVALTYPLDKIGDGKAQAFSMWLKEYLYNVFMQPFHLIIYTVFFGIAADLVKENLLFATVAIGFLLPAEKLIKKLFGFDNPPLGTMGALAGFTAGSLASKMGGKSGRKSAINTNKGEKTDENKPPRFEKKHGTDGIEIKNLGTGEESSSSNSEENKEEEDKKEALRKYEQEGYGKNADGEYYNPWTDEYDKNYDPTKDTTYMPKNAENIEQNDENQQQNINEQAQGENKKTTFRQGMGNVINAHGGGKAIAKRTAGRAIKGAAFMGKTAFKASAVAMGAAAGLASGQGIAAVVAGAKGGLTVAEKLGNSVESGVYSAYGKAKTTFASGQTSPIGKFRDEFNVNTKHQDAAGVKAFMKEDSTDQYIRDKLSNDKGRAPTREELKTERESIKQYADEGLTDIAQIYRAKKAEKFGVSAEQSAKIALLAQERKIDSKVLGDEKQYNQRKADFTQEFVDKGLSNDDATKQADYILNVMKAQVGQKHNLEKIQQNPQQSPAKLKQSKKGKK